MLIIGWALHMALIRAGRREYPLKLEARHNILPASQAQLSSDPCVIGLKAGSQDDRTHVYHYLFFLVVEVDSTRGTFLFTDTAFLAQAQDPAVLLVNSVFKGHRL